MKRLQFSVGAVALALALVSCGKGPSDDSLANDVKAKLYADTAVKQANVDVAVKDGAVTLTGSAPTSDAALAAVNDANSVSGVKHVDNQIAVAAAGSQLPNAGQSMPAPPPPAPMAQTNTNDERERHREHEEERRDQREQAPPPVMALTIPAGTPISVRTADTVSSASAEEGQTFPASLAEGIAVNGQIVVPRGAPVTLALVAARSAGRMAGQAELQMQVASIRVHGQSYQVASSAITELGNKRGRQTAVRTGIGAAAGAIIGALAGGGKGAAIGSAAGAGTGLGVQAFTRGKQVTLPAESLLNFTLTAPLTIQ